jgi:cysteine desulfurase family protein (TIGR01976 family)
VLDVEALRAEFPALAGEQIFLDGPAGTQVPNRVIAAITNVLTTSMSNVGGPFASSHRSSDTVAAARQAGADLVGSHPDQIVFGPNMTSLTFAVSRALAEGWREGDRVVLSGLDHDANITPWVRAAAGKGVEVALANVRADATLDIDHLESLIDDRTRLVAVTACSNAFGTLVDVGRVARAAHRVGALAFVDAVHFAPHRFIDVEQMDCDFLVCSAYKFFGPHLGLLWGRADLISDLPAFKVRPAPDTGPARWETGTPAIELLAGFEAAVDYIASIGWGGDRRGALESAFSEIRAQEELLGKRFVAGLPERAKVIGPVTMENRVPTFSVDIEGIDAAEASSRLGERWIATWAGNFYALEPMRRLGFDEKGGLIRIGFLHINIEDEVDAVLEAIRAL